MNILDAVIIIFLILGIMSGFRRGLIKQVVLLVGLIAIIVISYYLKDPVAAFLYKNLPFFSFNGIFQGISILNILIYELIAFLLVFSLLYLVLRILLAISGLIEKVLKATIILGFFSKIAGGIVGFIESYVIIFIILFIFSQPFLNIKGMNDSKISNKILTSTPVMSNAVKDTREVFDELDKLSKLYEDKNERFNDEAINLFIKYNIISDENVKILKEKGKI